MTYYNEFDRQAAEWLRYLMKAGLIPVGDVDERDIRDVRADDLRHYEQCHFFAGIGGWPYALRLAGWDGPVWTGSCPCQPFSVAGKGCGEDDERHLWPAFRRLISECRPSVVFGEQVAGKDGLLWLAGVRADLEADGYAVGAADLCAAGVGSPHIRQRLYWVAYSEVPGNQKFRQSHSGTDAGTQVRSIRPDERSGDVHRLADNELRGCAGGQLQDRERRAGASSADSGQAAPLRLGDGLCTGLEGHAGDGARRNGDEREVQEPDRPTSPHGHASFWTSAIWHHCRDGKARRIPAEPEIFPLAHGVPGRVGLLRGAGNAIVPPLAAEFVGAVMETVTIIGGEGVEV